MKFVYSNINQVFRFGLGYTNELVVENKKLFFEIVNNMMLQAEGVGGNCVLSIADKTVEFSKYADVTVQFAPFQLNRKNLLTKFYSALEKKAMDAENYSKTLELLGRLENYVYELADEFDFEVDCKKVAVGPLIRALAPEIEETDKNTIEKIFSYMELIREIDRDRLFIMVNMRTYFDDYEMECFLESVCLHDFKVLLLENTSFKKLKNTHRCTIDDDLCEF